MLGLLTQPGGFERLGPVEVGPDSLDLSVAHLEHLEEADLDRSPAASAPSVGTNCNKHKVTGGGELLRFVVTLLRPDVPHHLDPLAQIFVAPPDGSVGDSRQVVGLYVGMEALKPGVDIPGSALHSHGATSRGSPATSSTQYLRARGRVPTVKTTARKPPNAQRRAPENDPMRAQETLKTGAALALPDTGPLREERPLNRCHRTPWTAPLRR